MNLTSIVSSHSSLVAGVGVVRLHLPVTSGAGPVAAGLTAAGVVVAGSVAAGVVVAGSVIAGIVEAGSILKLKSLQYYT